MGLIGLLVAIGPEPVPAQHRRCRGSISIVGVVIFTALTAYDVQRIQNGTFAAAIGSMEKAAVSGRSSSTSTSSTCSCSCSG